MLNWRRKNSNGGSGEKLATGRQTTVLRNIQERKNEKSYESGTKRDIRENPARAPYSTAKLSPQGSTEIPKAMKQITTTLTDKSIQGQSAAPDKHSKESSEKKKGETTKASDSEARENGKSCGGGGPMKKVGI